MAKLIDAGVDQKTLESEDARIPEAPQLRRIPRHHAAPETHIHPAVPLRRCDLGLKRLACGCRWNAIQRNIHESGDTSGRSSARRLLERGPAGAAGFVDMHVG